MSFWGGRSSSSHCSRTAIDSKLIMMQFNDVSKVCFLNNKIIVVASDIAFNSCMRHGVKHYTQFNINSTQEKLKNFMKLNSFTLEALGERLVA